MNDMALFFSQDTDYGCPKTMISRVCVTGTQETIETHFRVALRRLAPIATAELQLLACRSSRF